MPRSRRIASFAVLAVIGGLALAGCGRSQPSVAAYVGDHRYTDKQVQQFVSDARNAGGAENSLLAQRLGLSYLVLADVGRLAAADLGVSVGSPDYTATARLFEMPETTAFVHAGAEWFAVVGAVGPKAQPVQATDADLREMYQAQIDSGEVPPGSSYDAFVQDMRSRPNLGLSVAVRNLLRDTIAKHNVKIVVNPQYWPLSAPVGVAPLVLGRSGSVVDLPSSAPSGQSEEDQAPGSDESVPN